MATATSSPDAPDRRALVIAVVVIVTLVIVYAAALVRGGPTARVGASIAEIQADPDEVLGERWVIAGEVRDVIDEQLVVVGGPAFGVAPLPVVLTSRARDAVEQGLDRGDVGQFVGSFQRLDVDQLERRLRVDLADERLEGLEESLVLIADRAAVDDDTE